MLSFLEGEFICTLDFFHLESLKKNPCTAKYVGSKGGKNPFSQ
jgi:hypothetical protein